MPTRLQKARSLLLQALWTALVAFVMLGALWAVTQFLPPLRPHMQWPSILGVYGLAVIFVTAIRIIGQLRQKDRQKQSDDDDAESGIITVRALVTFIAAFCFLGLAYSGYLVSENDPEPNKRFLVNLTKEAGFALLVALVIWFAFGIFKQEESEDRWNKRLKLVQKSVFLGVFRRNFPDALIQEANRLFLGQNFIRTGFHVLYTLNDATFEDAGDTKPCVLLESIQQFKMKNVSAEKQTLQIQAALANPLIPALKDKCRVRGVKIRREGRELDAMKLDEAEAKFRAAMILSKAHHVHFELPPLELAPDEEVEVVWDIVTAKDDEDAEVMTFYYPTDAIRLTVVDRCKVKRHVGARSIHREDLTVLSHDDVTGSYSYGLDHYFLPKQGYIVWWSKVPTSLLEMEKTNGRRAITLAVPERNVYQPGQNRTQVSP